MNTNGLVSFEVPRKQLKKARSIMSTLRHRKGSKKAEARSSPQFVRDRDETLQEPLIDRADEQQADAVPSTQEPKAVEPADSRPKRGTLDAVGGALLTVACGLLDILPNSFAKKVFATPIPPKQQNLIRKFQDEVVVPFRKETPAHREMLVELWDALHAARQRRIGAPGSASMPTLASPLPDDLVSMEWKDFGFQGNDPSTDFRGAGVLSLRNLLYFSCRFPDVFAKLLNGDEYPAAAAGINATMQLMNLATVSTQGMKTILDRGEKEIPYSTHLARLHLIDILTKHASVSHSAGIINVDERSPCSVESSSIEQTFGEVFCVFFVFLDKEWRASKRNLLEFNEVIVKARKRMEVVLRKASTLREVLDSVALE